MGIDSGATRPEAHVTSEQTVWQHDDAAMRQLGENPPASHWSAQSTQPLSPRWPAQMRRRVAEQRAAAGAGRESRAARRGAGWGILLTLGALCLVLLLALVNGWLPGGSSGSSDSPQFPVPAQSAPHTSHTPIPGATSFPTSTALPGATVAPTATAQATATAQPTATSQPTATPNPTPRPTVTPPATQTP